MRNISIWPTWFITLDNLIQFSPVPVKFVENMQPGYNGFYSHDKCFEFDADHHIEIQDSLKNYKKLAVLIHEIAHAKCDKRNCSCMKNSNRKYREIHAYMYELEWLLKHKQKKALKWVTTKLTGFTLCDDDYYAEAAKHIMETKLWQKCLDYIGD